MLGTEILWHYGYFNPESPYGSVLESMKVGNKKEDGIEENSVYLILL
jgi:hypothetical protein